MPGTWAYNILDKARTERRDIRLGEIPYHFRYHVSLLNNNEAKTLMQTLKLGYNRDERRDVDIKLDAPKIIISQLLQAKIDGMEIPL